MMQFYTKPISLNCVQCKDCLKLVKSIACILFVARNDKNNGSEVFQEWSLIEIYHNFIAKYFAYKYTLVK